MTPEQWQHVKDLLEGALARAPHQRAAFLADACAGDGALQHEVESLLAAHAQAGSFLETPAVAGAAPGLTDEHTPAVVERQIGPYKLTRELGRGGMGEVYLAVRADDHYQKRVAIKLVKRGMDTGAILRRFRTERQILASLNHPNIARLLDGGTTPAGRPYLVMEYVEGLPIDVYCDRHKLSISERLQLFRPVCAAVHYAHQNLVVHRDLKPSNLLVSADGVPTLLDFGIAKLLNPELSAPSLAFTMTGLQLMTPEYASPEQVRGEPITTATDVYALGVLLYELLTGHRPYRLKSRLRQDIERVICEEDPQKPSTAISRIDEEARTDGSGRLTPDTVSQTREGQPEKLRRRLAGDLDNIVLMALRKEPQRRYGSAEHLAEDIRRHLEGLPVMARPQTLGYRSAKFITRHKTGVLAAALLGVTLVGGLVSTTWQARVAETERARAEAQTRVAEAERARAERRFNDVRTLATSFLFEFHAAIEKLPGSTPARELLVKRALEYLASLAQEASNDPSLQRELAAAYEKVGTVQWQRYYAHLGDTAGALQSQRKALAMREALVATDPTNGQRRRDLARSHVLVGDVLVATGDLTGGLAHYRQSLAVREALAAADPSNGPGRYELAISYQRIGDTLGNPRFTNLGDTAGALESYRKMLAIFEALVAADPHNAQKRHSLSIGYEKIGDMQAARSDPAGALASHRQALALRTALSEADPGNAQIRRDVAVSLWKIGAMLAALGDHAGALASHRNALAIRQALLAADPTNATARSDLAHIYGELGKVLAALGDYAGALASHRDALAIWEALATADPLNRIWPSGLARTLQRLAQLSVQAGDLAAARGYTRGLFALQQEHADRATATPADLHAYARTLLTCEPPELQEPAAALRYAQRAVAMPHGQDAALLGTLALAYHRTGDQARAIATIKQALTLAPGDAVQRQELEAHLTHFTAAQPRAPER